MAFVPVSYSNGIPVLASNGTQRVACSHLALWLATYDALQVARGRGHVTYYQTVGGADASAGTHLCGSAWDMAYISDAAIADAREMGAAQWHRIPGYGGWPSSGADHCHGLILCGDNACNRYQYTAWLGGYNGLGLNGWGAGDPLPRPETVRTWQDGIAWAKAEIARLTTPATQEDPMIRFSCSGTVYMCSLASGAFYAVPTQEFDGVVIGMPGVTTMGELNARQRDILRDMCGRAAAASNPTAAAVVATVDPAAIAAALVSAGPALAKAVVGELTQRLAS
jgi:hypothetical protein